MDAETIVSQGLALLKQDGLPGVTFRQLTTNLRVKAPAIYWRFKDKRELLEAMAEAMLRQELGDLAPMPAGQAGRPWLRSVLHRLRRAMLAYPDGARVVAGARPVRTPTLARIPEYGLRALEDGGLPLARAATIVYTAVHYTFGHVIEEQDSAGAEAAEEFAVAYPTVARVMHEGRRLGLTATDIFDAGLSLILAESADPE
ncbi:TetR/AcrR family transcriptional regulator C-terminal domain-containing protein [Dactylosporangium aurantiacum]|uniref:TetR/AcrR family transcriptional regulator C-terminal domain-containing protein n=1 Tax=Dactylosporangium aurantiacum TaxID=35754 RepID=A0A9Q9MM70_9ACTN|nr:TetR/AcrR family transcriptional regulator C-terminal domain-containing protein [Dactylosporangium aurantiacum]MDG6103274.1 TetR/AcrR family transcriptional regulator C-terminal domain-containing protein [Dactylosporangium aurantiacum]UWZ57776.1 TetR/AcrR family transcriptional regulator C-terminal domain-containing protein [Dactylosporangium aurantiacum]